MGPGPGGRGPSAYLIPHVHADWAGLPRLLQTRPAGKGGVTGRPLACGMPVRSGRHLAPPPPPPARPRCGPSAHGLGVSCRPRPPALERRGDTEQGASSSSHLLGMPGVTDKCAQGQPRARPRGCPPGRSRTPTVPGAAQATNPLRDPEDRSSRPLTFCQTRGQHWDRRGRSSPGASR